MNPVLLLAALLPAIILLIRVYKLDKIEKEPRPLLVKLVIVGALTAKLDSNKVLLWALIALAGGCIVRSLSSESMV